MEIKFGGGGGSGGSGGDNGGGVGGVFVRELGCFCFGCCCCCVGLVRDDVTGFGCFYLVFFFTGL